MCLLFELFSQTFQLGRLFSLPDVGLKYPQSSHLFISQISQVGSSCTSAAEASVVLFLDRGQLLFVCQLLPSSPLPRTLSASKSS